MQYEPQELEKRILKLTDYMINGLEGIGVNVVSPLEREHRSGMVVYQASKEQTPKGDWKTLVTLTKANIAVSLRYSGGQGGIRTGVHYFNTEEDIDKLLEAQKSCS